MTNLLYRPRRLRKSAQLRLMVRQTKVDLDDLIMPLFAIEGHGIKQNISSMPGIERMTADLIEEKCRKLLDSGINSVLLFGIPGKKDEDGSCGADDNAVVQSCVRRLKKALPRLFVITDVCNCEYTSHGHCGPVVNGQVDNDKTLEILARQALSHAAAGADMVAPSDMMDGRVAAIRQALDSNSFQMTPIMSYSAKYASAFYGPFREAAGSSPSFGDRRSYQMDSANAREALRECRLDEEEGADILMVKPALSYLDIIHSVRENTNLPVAAYNVSGEYSMVKAAAAQGWIDEKKIVSEILTSIKRAGADLIITYHAELMAEIISEGNI